MEDRDDQRRDEIVSKPLSIEDAHKMLEKVRMLQDNLTFSSSDGAMAGNIDSGFLYASRAGSDQPEVPEGPEGPEVPEQ